MRFDGRAAALRTEAGGPGGKLNRAAKKLNALSHGPQAIGLGGVPPILRLTLKPFPSSSILIADGLRPTGQGDLDIVGIRVGDHVGQRPLKYFV